jgi:hypothetical protein
VRPIDLSTVPVDLPLLLLELEYLKEGLFVEEREEVEVLDRLGVV